ncbi:MAG: aspartate aminotransferase family protein [Gemmatimonadota bacterium]|nr:MAG: aspartate aminotransferase family protein [Gemmatimonadota bacterium]
MKRLPAGDLLPRISVTPPGPESRRLAAALRRCESPNVTYVADDFPIFWREAGGANVLDVDGNIYIDLTAGFGVAAAGHANMRVNDAIRGQLDRLVHGLGDVHPPEIKVTLLERLAQITPDGLTQSILASSGAEAVEAALKTARLASGAPGVLCFTGAYHGLTYGALAVTDGEAFRAPFQDQISVPVVRVPFPDPYRPPAELAGHSDLAHGTLDLVAERLDAGADPIGAVIVEPILGRGGVVIPPTGFLPGLRQECDRRGLILIVDEIYTGLGRTGSWFACDHEAVVPDLLCLGKALSGSLPFSACIGRPEIMAAWPPSEGAAIHTSTFLGHPLACAAALAHLDEIQERGLVARSADLGEELFRRLQALQGRVPGVGHVRGRGLLAGIELVRDPDSRAPDSNRAHQVVVEALRRGLILLADGPAANVLTLTPPLTISEEQLDFGLRTLEDCLLAA